MKHIFIFFFLCFSINLLYGNYPYSDFYALNTGNGKLTHNTVQALTRDDLGYIWVGTNYGLNRLDGYQTINFLSVPNDSNSLSGSFIKALFVDSENNLWVGTIGGGLNKFDRNTNGFIHYLPSAGKNSISGLNISAITEDKSGHIWIGTIGNEVNRLDKKTDRFDKYNLDSISPFHYSNSNVEKLFCDKDGNIWAGYSQGEVFRINTITSEITFFGLEEPDEGSKKVGSVKGISQLVDGTLLFATWNGNLYKLTPEIDKHIVLLKDAAYFDYNNLTDIAIDHDNRIWVSTWRNGLYTIDPLTFKKTTFNRNKYLLNSLCSNALTLLFVDKNNNLLIGTSDNGVSILPLQKKMFNVLALNESGSDIPDDLNVYSIVRDHCNNLWIGTRGQGLIRYNLITHKTKTYLSEKYKGMESNSILCLRINDDNKIWIGTDGNFISKFDPETERFTPIENRFNDWSKAIFCMAENDQYLWGGSWGGGIKKIDKKTGSYTSIDFDKKDQFRNSIFDLELRDSILWVANVGLGLIKYNINSGHKTIYSNSGKFPNFPKERIIDLFIENPSTLWISTDGAGLFLFNPLKETIENYGAKFLLAESIIQSIVADKDSNLWITSISGISYINRKTNNCYNFDKHNGLQNNQFNKSAIFYDKTDNLIYTGGIEGVNFFDPSEIIIDSTCNKVTITELRIMGKTLFYPNSKNLFKTIDSSTELHLFHSDKMVTIFFSSMEFNPSSKNKYIYQLEGFDKELNEVPYSKNFVQYTNLYPGIYTFRVKASSSDGIFSDQETKLKIIVHPAFWQTLIFKTFLLIVSIFIIFLYFRNHYKKLLADKNELEEKVLERTSEIQLQKEKIEQQNHELEQANESKDKFFSIISHDLRNPVTTINQLAELILVHHNIASQEKMVNYFNLLKKTSSNTLELLDDLLVWARTQTNRIEIKKKDHNVDDLINNAINICKPIADKKNIKLIYPDHTTLKVFVDRNSIHTVLRNLLTNAIKFSRQNSNVEIAVEPQDNKVIIKIIDNGIGMSQNEKDTLFRIEGLSSKIGTAGEPGTGLGLILCYEFLILNGGRIWVESEKDKGSTFFFSVERATE